MSVIDFDRVSLLNIGDVSSINEDLAFALGPITDPTDTRTSLYDPDWGYYIVEQNTTMNYVEDKTYEDLTNFTIYGAFTINAERATDGIDYQGDDSTFDAVVRKYEALEQKLRNAAKTEAPEDYNDWFTENDLRYIFLPEPLRDIDGNRIRVRVLDFNIEPGQWGNFIRYRCVLEEVKSPPCKAIVANYILDDAVMSFTLPAPILSRSQMVGCHGEVLQLHNYTMMQLDVQGTVSQPAPSGSLLNKMAHELMSALSVDKVDIGVVRFTNAESASPDVLWPNMSMLEGTNVDTVFEEQLCQITVRTVAGKN